MKARSAVRSGGSAPIRAASLGGGACRRQGEPLGEPSDLDPLTGCPLNSPSEIAWRLENRQAAFLRDLRRRS